nr:hypothetical protein Iba_chr15dCG8320 [Ipomoea batatas]
MVVASASGPTVATPPIIRSSASPLALPLEVPSTGQGTPEATVFQNKRGR